MILASHIGDIVRAYCSRAVVLHRGRGKVFDDLDVALDIYEDL
jgi:capsular polysaccharide transport system ATP-binding protein